MNKHIILTVIFQLPRWLSISSHCYPHTHYTRPRNRLHFSSAGFWRVCHTHLGPDSSGTRNRRRIEHCSISKPGTGVHVTEMMIYHHLLFIFVISCEQSVNSRVVIYVFIIIHHLRSLQPRLFLRQKFSFQTHMVRKPAWENGVDLWHRFLERVS